MFLNGVALRKWLQRHGCGMNVVVFLYMVWCYFIQSAATRVNGVLRGTTKSKAKEHDDFVCEKKGEIRNTVQLKICWKELVSWNVGHGGWEASVPPTHQDAQISISSLSLMSVSFQLRNYHHHKIVIVLMKVSSKWTFWKWHVMMTKLEDCHDLKIMLCKMNQCPNYFSCTLIEPPGSFK